MGASDENVMLFERFAHYCNIVSLGWAILHYATQRPDLFQKDHYGYLLVGLCLQHVFEQFMHETGPSTTASILHENRIWTTYAVLVFHGYSWTHGGYDKVLDRFMAEPFFLFLSIVGCLMGAHASCATNWMLGTYAALEGGWPFPVRVVNFIASLGLVGFLVKKYLETHNEQALKLQKSE